MTKILVIDDDPLQVDLMGTYLSHSGYQTLGACDAAAGIALYHQEHPDVVLCDLVMPGGGGLAVLEVVRLHSSFVPFVVISGTNDLSQAVDALKRGAWDYLLKPLAGYELLNPLILRLLERAQLLRDNAAYQEHLEDLVQERTFELVKQLHEKDVLLAEVHHRVKNNLQVLLSLLDAERQIPVPSDDPWARWELTVRSLALVQEELHAAAVGSAVPFERYLTSLVHHGVLSHQWSSRVTYSVTSGVPEGAPALALTVGLVLLFALEILHAPDASWSLEVTFQHGPARNWTLTIEGPLAPDSDRSLARRDLEALLGATGATAQFLPSGLTVTLA